MFSTLFNDFILNFSTMTTIAKLAALITIGLCPIICKGQSLSGKTFYSPFLQTSSMRRYYKDLEIEKSISFIDDSTCVFKQRFSPLMEEIVQICDYSVSGDIVELTARSIKPGDVYESVKLIPWQAEIERDSIFFKRVKLKPSPSVDRNVRQVARKFFSHGKVNYSIYEDLVCRMGEQMKWTSIIYPYHHFLMKDGDNGFSYYLEYPCRLSAFSDEVSGTYTQTIKFRHKGRYKNKKEYWQETEPILNRPDSTVVRNQYQKCLVE